MAAQQPAQNPHTTLNNFYQYVGGVAGGIDGVGRFMEPTNPSDDMDGMSMVLASMMVAQTQFSHQVQHLHKYATKHSLTGINQHINIMQAAYQAITEIINSTTTTLGDCASRRTAEYINFHSPCKKCNESPCRNRVQTLCSLCSYQEASKASGKLTDLTAADEDLWSDCLSTAQQPH